MKRSRMTPVALGLTWLFSLGLVFVLGLFLAFAFHLDPDHSRDDDSLELRQLGIVIERLLGEPLDYGEMMSMANRDRFPEQLEQALTILLNEHGVYRRDRALEYIAEGLPARKRISGIQFLFEQPPSVNRELALQVFFEQWGRSDGRSALAMANRVEDPFEREPYVLAVLAGWGQTRPRDAWQWLRQNEGDSGQVRLTELMWQITRFHPDDALSLLHQLPEDHSARDAVWLSFADALIQAVQPEEALNWVGELPSGWLQLEMVRMIGEAMGARSPRAAMVWIEDEAPEGLGDILAETVVRTWSRNEPEAVLEWLEQRPQGAERRAMIQLSAESWVNAVGPVPLSQWLNTQPASADWDAAIEVLVVEVMDRNPRAALSWAQVISSPESRVYYEMLVARNWVLRDSETALAALEELLSTDEARALILGAGPTPVESTVLPSMDPEYTIELEEPEID